MPMATRTARCCPAASSSAAGNTSAVSPVHFRSKAALTLGSGTGRFQGNDGIYGMVDQMVYRVPGTDDGAVGIFARVSGSPGDRNLVSFYADGGVTGKGVVPGRPDDTLGLSGAFTQISPAAQRTDRMEQAIEGPAYPIRSNEILVEATYQAQIVPGFTVQPDAQYVVRPGGGIPDPTSASFRPIRDAAVFGSGRRSNIDRVSGPRRR